MLTVKLQSGQYFLCPGSFESFKSKDKKPCLSTNIFASNVQKSLKLWCRVHESLHALPARARASSNSFRCLPLPRARPKVPAALRLALAAPAATHVDRAHARWIRKAVVVRQTTRVALSPRSVSVHLVSCTIKFSAYGGYSSAVEHRTVAPAVVGSNPTTHPNSSKHNEFHRGPSPAFADQALGWRLTSQAKPYSAGRNK